MAIPCYLGNNENYWLPREYCGYWYLTQDGAIGPKQCLLILTPENYKRPQVPLSDQFFQEKEIKKALGKNRIKSYVGFDAEFNDDPNQLRPHLMGPSLMLVKFWYGQREKSNHLACFI